MRPTALRHCSDFRWSNCWVPSFLQRSGKTGDLSFSTSVMPNKFCKVAKCFSSGWIAIPAALKWKYFYKNWQESRGFENGQLIFAFACSRPVQISALFFHGFFGSNPSTSTFGSICAWPLSAGFCCCSFGFCILADWPGVWATSSATCGISHRRLYHALQRARQAANSRRQERTVVSLFTAGNLACWAHAIASSGPTKHWNSLFRFLVLFVFFFSFFFFFLFSFFWIRSPQLSLSLSLPTSGNSPKQPVFNWSCGPCPSRAWYSSRCGFTRCRPSASKATAML